LPKEEHVNTPASKNIGLAEVAKAFDISPSELEQQLALLGWGIVMNEAERLAFSDAFAGGTSHLTSQRALGELEHSTPPMRWENLEAAFRTLLPQLARGASKTARVPKDRREGAIYVLHDGVTGLSKIGCTSGTGRRQRSQMASHGTVLVNLVNAKVADMRAAEAQCHEHFKEYRRNGEWFAAPIDKILRYIAGEIDWQEIDRENDARLVQYFAACRLGDMKAAKAALNAPNHPLAEAVTPIVVRTYSVEE
jgi:hypothetical protein